MPYPIVRCRAPSPFSDTDECGKEFYQNVPNKFYCGPTCRHRAQRRNAKKNAFKRGVQAPARAIIQQVKHLEDFELSIDKLAPKEDVYDAYFKQTKDPSVDEL